jgi:1,4-dihydroxy-2-naphthoate octaprenyltransferase
MNNFIACIPAIRPRFLILAPICVLLGQSVGFYHQFEFQLLSFILAMIGAIFSAVTVNCLNEYQDFHSGLDLITSPTPFSGGSGLLKAQPHLANYVLKIAILSTSMVFLIGIYFSIKIGIKLIPIGLLGLTLIFTYTKWLNKSPFLCLVAPGLGFGVLMFVGTYLTQTLSYKQDVWLISLIPFFLINNLLLINQFPDIQSDKISGRNHLAIKYGTNFASGVFIFFASSSVAVLCFLVFKQTLPVISLVCLLPLSLSFIAFVKIFSLGENIAQCPKAMILNVASANLTPLLLAISLFIAA